MQKLCWTAFDRKQGCHADANKKKRSVESRDLQATLKSACEASKQPSNSIQISTLAHEVCAMTGDTQMAFARNRSVSQSTKQPEPAAKGIVEPRVGS